MSNLCSLHFTSLTKRRNIYDFIFQCVTNYFHIKQAVTNSVILRTSEIVRECDKAFMTNGACFREVYFGYDVLARTLLQFPLDADGRERGT